MRWYRADLHIHSVLSPCGGLDMSPKNIFAAAKRKNIDLIAITDHNSMKNSSTYYKVAKKMGFAYLFGVEIQTLEEIHIIALFDNQEKALSFDSELYNSLLPIKNNPDYFGDQVIIDENENIIGFEERALINSSSWNYEETILKVRKFDGFCFPAHIDASTYSVISQLGFIPKNPQITAVGITKNCDTKYLVDKFPYLKKYAFIRNSDAHYPNEVGGGYTDFFIKEPTISEIGLAVKNLENRKYIIGG